MNMKRKFINGIVTLVLAIGMALTACSNPVDSGVSSSGGGSGGGGSGGGGGITPRLAPAVVFLGLDVEFAELMELTFVSQTQPGATWAAAPGTYNYTLNRSGATISEGTATIATGGNTVFASRGNKRWTAKITNTVTVSDPIPVDTGGAPCQPLIFYPDKTASELAAVNLDGKWINPCVPLNAFSYYTFSGNTFTHTATNYVQNGTFNRTASMAITFTATSGERGGTWSQRYKLLNGDSVLFLQPDSVHNHGPFVRSSGAQTPFEGIWTNSGKATLTIMDNVFWVNRIENGYNGANWTDGYVVASSGDTSIGTLSFSQGLTVRVSGNRFTVAGMTGDLAFLDGTYTLSADILF